MPIDHDAPEREVLNLMESLAIVRMHRRLYFRKRAELDRTFLCAASSMRRFAKVIADNFPMDDWDDVIAEIAGG